MRRIILLFTLLVHPIISNAQEREVFGRILDSESEKPIYGAHVIALGTTQGTSTNQLGYFRFTISADQSVLVVSYIGYETFQLEIPESNRILLKMQRNYEILPLVNIKYVNTRDLPPADTSKQEEIDTFNIEKFKTVEKIAEYPGGLKYFYNDLSKILKADSNLSLLPDTVFFLKFCVESNGTTVFKSLRPRIAKIESALRNASNIFSKWNSAEQRGLAVTQCFEIPLINKKQEFFEAEEPAEPNGGINAFEEFVEKTLVYPKTAKRMGVEGKVFIWFTIDKDGQVKDPVVIKGLGAGCDEEAVRILKKYPKWNPGRHAGETVKQKYTVSITFGL